MKKLILFMIVGQYQIILNILLQEEEKINYLYGI